MRKPILLILFSLLLCGCGDKTMQINEKEETQTTTPEIIEYEPTAPSDETEVSEGENQQVKYKEGEFDWVHDKFFESYSDKDYQSFSKSALIDLLTNEQSEMFEDAICFISNKDYNQFYVFKIKNDEELVHIENFYLSMKSQLENDPVAENEAVWSFMDQGGKIVTIAFGSQDFISEMDTLKNYIYEGSR